MRILLVGPQGSGKTTQAELLSKKNNIGMVIIGNMLRERAQMDDALGAQIRSDQAEGILVADETVAAILKEKLTAPEFAKGFVIDGWPRKMSQLHLFDPGYDVVLNLVVSEDVTIDRLMKRGRADDNPEAIRKRLSIYYEQTQQVLEHYKQMGLVREVDGNQSVEDVAAQIEKEVHIPGLTQNLS